MIPSIREHEAANDAVVQGLSEIPFMQDVEHWGVPTIGTVWAMRDSQTAVLRKTEASFKLRGFARRSLSYAALGLL
jgi:hypothetical protein